MNQIDDEHVKVILDTLDWIRNGNISGCFDEYSTSSGPGNSQPEFTEVSEDDMLFDRACLMCSLGQQED